MECDIQTGEKLNPVYICFTCSANTEGPTDFESNSVASRVNLDTFTKGGCWTSVFYNELTIDRKDWRQEVHVPGTDNDYLEYIDGHYLVWSVTKEVTNHYGAAYSTDGTLNRTLLGLISEEYLFRDLPKVADDLRKQKYFFRIE